jgi:3-deoxy-7-phosphoheptulonate synthase
MINAAEAPPIAAESEQRIPHAPDEMNASWPLPRTPFVSSPYRLAGRELHPQDSVFSVIPTNGVSFQVGADAFSVIGGPCTVESEQQIVETAIAVRRAGGAALRGGAFKPRTSPYSFQGLKEDGLKMLATARKETGLAVVTEVMSIDKVDLVAEYADIIQIGSRNMQNYPLLEAVGALDKPVLLKRGLSATVSEFLSAAEYVLARGNQSVILCERGIRTFESDTRFTLALGTVALLKEKTHLPILVDPSHGVGKASLVRPMSRAAIAAGADGLLIEVHPDPIHSVVDGDQSIGFDTFAAIMNDILQLAPIVGKSICHAASIEVGVKK